MTELLLGCGFARQKLLGPPGDNLQWKDLVTTDINLKCGADIWCDLDDKQTWRPLPYNTDASRHPCLEKVPTVSDDGVEDWHYHFKENYFDEVHAYEVLEHLGSQGDAVSFFATFSNIHRVLKPNGHLFATVPSRYSPWLWGDPSHRRAILKESLIFLDQAQVTANRKAGSPMSDFSDLWTRNFRIISSTDNHSFHMFCLKAIK